MARAARPLVELHCHVGGCLTADDLLDLIAGREVDWSAYEAAFARAYGEPTPVRAIVAAARAGEPDARRRFRDLFVFGDARAGDFDRFSANWGIISSVLPLHATAQGGVPERIAEDTRFVIGRIAGHCRDQGIAACEVRFKMDAGDPADFRRDMYRTMLRAMAAESRSGVDLTLAISLPREAAWDTWTIARDLALGDLGERLTAIDFCHVEEGFPPRRQRAVADDLRRHNAEHPRRALALLYHVGESFRGMSIESAVRWCHEAAVDLGAHRLGHAIALGITPGHFGTHRRREAVAERLDQIAYDIKHAEGLRAAGVAIDPAALAVERRILSSQAPDHLLHVDYAYDRLDDLVARQRFACRAIAAAGAVVEVCPTSNRRIAGFTDPACHQLHRFLEVGLPFVVGADDPGILDTDLARELAWVVEHARLSSADAQALEARAWASRSTVLSGRFRAGGFV